MIGNRRGNMPFALIAVTILLLASVAGAVVTEHARSEKGVRDTESGKYSLEASLFDVQSYVNQELGSIVLDVSRDPSLGTLDERAEVFRQRADDWIDYRFPIRSGKTLVDLRSRSLNLVADPMDIVSDGPVTGGRIPSYLRGVGTLSVTASSDYGKAEKDLMISTDGSYALPLAAEQSSMFERMVEGRGISLSQMMTYELQTLAQTRVLNGFGAKSQYGELGTDSILTREDVLNAYENALGMCGLLCFRDPDDGIVHDTMDLADAMQGDRLYLDGSAFYGQILMSVIDDAVIKWYDYLCLDFFTERSETAYRSLKVAIDALVRFVSGDDPFSAADYIKDVMKRNGVDPRTYRYPGSGTTTVAVGDITVTVDNPRKDVLDQSWIKKFNTHYSAGHNYIKDDIRYILNSAAERTFENMSGMMMVELDPYDDVSFLDSLTSALDRMSVEFGKDYERSLADVINEQKVFDPFYSAIADCVMHHAESLNGSDVLRKRIEDAIKLQAGGRDDIDELLASPEIDAALHRYRSAFYTDISVYDVLRSVEGKKNAFLDTMSGIVSFGLRNTPMMNMVEDRTRDFITEITASMALGPYSGTFPMPDTDFFLLADEAGNMTREHLSFSYSNDPVVMQPELVKSRCSHLTSLFNDSTAAYTTTFSVDMSDIIDYRVEGNGSLSSAMGKPSTSEFKGTLSNSIHLEISVASAWALMGVKYSASNTIGDDIWGILLNFFSPLMEPIREMIGIIMDVTDILGRCVMELSHYVTEAVNRIVERMFNPLEKVRGWVERNLEEMFAKTMIDLFFRLNLVEQRVGFEYMGYTVELKLDLVSLYSTTKNILALTVKGPLAGLMVEGTLYVKCRGEINGNNIFLTGKATLQSDDWKVKLGLDPMMKGSKHLVTISAEIDKVEISAVIPDLEDYNEIGLTLSRIPGIGEMISNIPLPTLGVNVGFDAGISIKYTAPMATGLVINEYETNPPGSDTGTEWVELLNNSGESIDLTGYTLVASSDRAKKKMVLSGSIAPGEYLVITPTFSMVNNSGKLTKNGEGLTLKDTEGVVVDKTGTHKDNSDDSKTWQRSYDGSSQWEFKEGTQGRSNGSYLSSKILAAEVAKEIMVESVKDAFEKVDAVTDTESLRMVMEEIIKSAVNRVIKKIAGCLVEASIFLKVDVKDASSSAAVGIRLALRCGSDLVEDVLKYIAGQVEEMALSIKNPYRINPVSMFTDNIDLEVTIDSRLQYPAILARSIEEELPKVDFGVTFRVNMSALTEIYGKDTGKPGIECGIRVIDCPTLIIPARMSPKSGMEHDFWLIRMNIEWT
ncbi:MAG: lamin tail domain-containing protein [Thermoplasmata archaeon]|nr:lamin tail domain-containing protein [Thermoplasmata archaeon]